MIELSPGATIAADRQVISISILGRPPSTNDLNRKVAQARWRERREWRAAAEQEAWAAKLVWEEIIRRKWQPLARADLIVTFVLPDRRRHDWDNLCSTVKPQLDGIVDAGILLDDSIEVLRSVQTKYRVQKGVTATTFDLLGYPK